MKIKIAVCLFASLCAINFGTNLSYCKDVQKAGVDFNKEFSQLQSAKESNIEDFKEASKKLDSDQVENKVATDANVDLTQINEESVQEIKLKYITTEEALSTLDKLFSNTGSSSYSSSGSNDDQKIKISTSVQTNSIILVGDKSAVSKAFEVISKVDKASPKILLQCIVTNMSDAAVKSLGTALNSLRTGTITGFNYLPDGGVSSDIGSSGTVQPNFTLGYSILTQDRLPTKFSVSLNDMITSQKGKIISRPYATVESGKTAKLTSTSSSYLILTSASSYATTQNLQNVSTGTNLGITPQALGNNLISVNLDISHSYMTNSPVGAISFVINESKASTNIVVKNGETIVIGGLKTSKESSYREGLPFLRFIPFLSSKQNAKEENEVVFFITPYIMDKSSPEGL